MPEEHMHTLGAELREALDTVIKDDGERRAVREELDEALSLSPPAREDRLVQVLRAHAATRAWIRDREPALVRDPDRLTGTGGDPTARLGTYFVCPKGDRDFVRESLGDEVPTCPVHGIPMLLQDD